MDVSSHFSSNLFGLFNFLIFLIAVDLSIYTDESQLEKTPPKKRKTVNTTDDGDSDSEPLVKKATKAEVSMILSHNKKVVLH